MNKVQEYFTSKDSLETLQKKVLDSGFTPFSHWPNSYSVNGNNYAFIVLQHAKDQGFSTDNGHVFYLELSKKPDSYPKSHPIVTFFKSLDSPEVLGTKKSSPKYSIDTYINKK
jgi:hypothetical protein